ncbi:MAG: indolepyruvate ferredoxin oxidoreductase subunit alpha [Clostridia bacterium]|jgi:indolepyruvate ferredoxin oxidoreductase alpha subunit|nr:indolepyruvate ferredoxin oxidoreductase subunit alpha [Clostridia bacterium]
MNTMRVVMDAPGEVALLTGNEAVARGALEAGVHYATSYPGSPTAEILECIAAGAEKFGLYAEWSVNEKVAMEGAAAASFAGLRSITIMKCDGLNVAFDFLTSFSMAGCRGGMVIVVGDDPSAHSSAKEEDSRYLGRVAHIPVLEPADSGEAKEMVKHAFDLSEALRQPVMLRLVTRVCHGSGNAVLGEFRRRPVKAQFPPEEKFFTWIEYHQVQEEKLAQAAELAEASPFNRYVGPPGAPLLVICSGPSFYYAREAVEKLGLAEEAGILKLGTLWPLPENLLLSHLRTARQVVFVEEVEPFLEENIKALAAQYGEEVGPTGFYGKKSGHVAGANGVGLGEMNPEQVLKALAAITGRRPPPAEDPALPWPEPVPRELAFCPGCPHRTSFWAVKVALELDGRQGVVLGDIGCYTLGKGRTGYHLLQTLHAMGSGVGLACGLGQLSRFGFTQPVVALVGDSTFYHAVVPALINGQYNRAEFLCVVLDNEATAMTGHQPHPGLEVGAMGQPCTPVELESVVRGLGIPVWVADPYRVEETIELVRDLLRVPGPKVLILRRACALVAVKKRAPVRVWVDPERCRGDACGCERFCSRVFSCPANIWDAEAGRARIDEAICNGCGVCATLCPAGAIRVEGQPLMATGSV